MLGGGSAPATQTKRDVCCRFWHGSVWPLSTVCFGLRWWQLPFGLIAVIIVPMIYAADSGEHMSGFGADFTHTTAARNLRRPLSCPSLLTLCISSRHVHVSKRAPARPQQHPAQQAPVQLDAKGKSAFIPCSMVVARLAVQPSSMLTTFSTVHLSSSRLAHGSDL